MLIKPVRVNVSSTLSPVAPGHLLRGYNKRCVRFGCMLLWSVWAYYGLDKSFKTIVTLNACDKLIRSTDDDIQSIRDRFIFRSSWKQSFLPDFCPSQIRFGQDFWNFKWILGQTLIRRRNCTAFRVVLTWGSLVSTFTCTHFMYLGTTVVPSFIAVSFVSYCIRPFGFYYFLRLNVVRKISRFCDTIPTKLKTASRIYIVLFREY